MRWMVALVAAPVLFWAANTSMLGVSRHIYTLAINRQIPSWLGKLERRKATPYVAITICGVIALGLVIPTNVKLLAGIYAFGATLAITIAHLSIIRLRVKDAGPDAGPSGSRWGCPGAGPSCRCRRSSPPSSAASPSSASSPTTTPPAGSAVGWMIFGLALLRRLPQGLRGDDADQAGLGHRARADQAGAGGRIPQHPRAGLRHQARRRHRRHRRPPGRGRAGGVRRGRGGRPARPRLRDRSAADPAARRAAAARARGRGAAGAGARPRGRRGVRGRRASAPR